MFIRISGLVIRVLSEQNYDPFIPYLAPYVEEAKFQLQEEEELLGYHMWDRRLYSGEPWIVSTFLERVVAPF